MLGNDYTAKVLNLEDVVISNVENKAETLEVYLELPVRVHQCPCCGQETTMIHDYRLQTSLWGVGPICT